jgi:hypothetical protein
MNKFILLLSVCLLGLSACTKTYRCECGTREMGSSISYKPGEETAAKAQCENAGCKFVQY